jgi:hypothetical protein
METADQYIEELETKVEWMLESLKEIERVLSHGPAGTFAEQVAKELAESAILRAKV